jgi:hypothetical protein
VGQTKLASYLRACIDSEKTIHVLPMPAGAVEVSRGSDYLLDVLAKEVAYAMRETVASSYIPDLGDAPPAVRALVEGYRPSTAPGLVY